MSVRSVKTQPTDTEVDIIRDVIRSAERSWVLQASSPINRMPLAHVLRSYETVLAMHNRDPDENKRLMLMLLKLNSMRQDNWWIRLEALLEKQRNDPHSPLRTSRSRPSPSPTRHDLSFTQGLLPGDALGDVHTRSNDQGVLQRRQLLLRPAFETWRAFIKSRPLRRRCGA